MRCALFLILFIFITEKVFGNDAIYPWSEVPTSYREQLIQLMEKGDVVGSFVLSSRLNIVYPNDQRNALIYQNLNSLLSSENFSTFRINTVLSGGTHIWVAGHQFTDIISQKYHLSWSSAPWLEEHFAKGYELTYLGAAESGMLAIMSKLRGSPPKERNLVRFYYGFDEQFQTDFATLKRLGMFIKSTTGSDNSLVPVHFKSDPGISDQRFIISKGWPADWIKSRNQESYHITTATYSRHYNKYLVIMSKGVAVNASLITSNFKNFIGKKDYQNRYWTLSQAFYSATNEPFYLFTANVLPSGRLITKQSNIEKFTEDVKVFK